MPVFRGNVGNLLQHWVLCDLLVSCAKYYEQIAFVDAYSMAPSANERPRRDQTAHLFDFVRERLPGDATPYEKAWHLLGADATTYPNSAAFLSVVWPGPFLMLLCEWDPTTARELELWAGDLRSSARCLGADIVAGDWRQRFREGLPSSTDLTFISFDPYMFDRHGSGRNPGNMDPTDLERLVSALDTIQNSVLVQLSTYSANNANAQADVREAISSSLEPSSLQEIAVVQADGNMMSLVYGRNLAIGDSMRSSPSRFTTWLNRIKYQYGQKRGGAA